MDHHVDAAITEGLRRRGVDVLTSREDGTTTWDDELARFSIADIMRYGRDFLPFAQVFGRARMDVLEE
jgi:hypothetical protein